MSWPRQHSQPTLPLSNSEATATMQVMTFDTYIFTVGALTGIGVTIMLFRVPDMIAAIRHPIRHGRGRP